MLATALGRTLHDPPRAAYPRFAVGGHPGTAAQCAAAIRNSSDPTIVTCNRTIPAEESTVSTIVGKITKNMIAGAVPVHAPPYPTVPWADLSGPADDFNSRPQLCDVDILRFTY